MPNTFNINQHCITVTDGFGDKTAIRTDSPDYAEAKAAVMRADWSTFEQLAACQSSNVSEESTADSPKVVILGAGTVGGMAGLIGMITNMTAEAVIEDDSEEFEAEDSFVSIEHTLRDVKGLLADGLISAEEIITDDNIDQFANAMPQDSASHEHDLSQWSGSPIFYPTREMAREQSDRWGMFWDYHDFGIASPAGYRYATVPCGIGPTAPDGYDWVCLPREE